MNKLVVLFCLLAIGLFIGDAFALNASVMQGGEPDNWYTEVQYQSLGGAVLSLEHGTVLQWTIDGDTGHDAGYTVRKASETADDDLTAGIVPGKDDSAHNLDTRGVLVDEDVFEMQIRGLATNIPTDGNVAAGTAIGSETTGYVGSGTGLGVALETDNADSSSPSATSADIYLNVEQQ